MTTHTIEKNIPMPAPRQVGSAMDKTLAAMAVGDSFLLQAKQPGDVYTRAKRLGIKVAVRRLSPTSHRVWRVS